MRKVGRKFRCRNSRSENALRAKFTAIHDRARRKIPVLCFSKRLVPFWQASLHFVDDHRGQKLRFELGEGEGVDSVTIEKVVISFALRAFTRSLCVLQLT